MEGKSVCIGKEDEKRRLNPELRLQSGLSNVGVLNKNERLNLYIIMNLAFFLFSTMDTLFSTTAGAPLNGVKA